MSTMHLHVGARAVRGSTERNPCKSHSKPVLQTCSDGLIARDPPPLLCRSSHVSLHYFCIAGATSGNTVSIGRGAWQTPPPPIPALPRGGCSTSNGGTHSIDPGWRNVSGEKKSPRDVAHHAGRYGKTKKRGFGPGKPETGRQKEITARNSAPLPEEKRRASASSGVDRQG